MRSQLTVHAERENDMRWRHAVLVKQGLTCAARNTTLCADTKRHHSIPRDRGPNRPGRIRRTPQGPNLLRDSDRRYRFVRWFATLGSGASVAAYAHFLGQLLGP